MANGAWETRQYPNYFSRIGIDDETAQKRVEECFQTIFFDPENGFYHDVDADSGCMEDTGNIDARTEGMSYGMMMTVQMDRKDLFDKLWCFSRRYMYHEDGKYQGYFAWSVQLDGTHNAEGPAPDGEEYFAMALFMAAARWGNDEGIYNYTEEARAILRHCVHQHELVEGGQPMWEASNHYIKFAPETPFTDPSYHLPHFYQLFAEVADEADREFWAKAAEASREYIILSAHPETGMSPEYSEYDGTPRLMFRKPYAYYSDAYRVAMNIALDHVWFGKNQQMSDVVTRLQNFFCEKVPDGDYKAYDLDGTPHDEPAMHPLAITSVLGAASISSESAYAQDCLRRFWEAPMRTGKRRYYDNCLYFFCMMMLSGQYRIYL
ncbi:MAG: xylanase [Clostridiales bacterium]|nr:xylanase [Clostridiales bacterium]